MRIILQLNQPTQAKVPKAEEPPVLTSPNLSRGYFPRRGMFYSLLVHELALIVVLNLPGSFNLNRLKLAQTIVHAAKMERMEPAVVMWLPVLKDGGPDTPLPSPKTGAGPETRAAAPRPNKEGLSYPGLQPILSDPPNPTNLIQTLQVPALENPPVLKPPLLLPNFVLTADAGQLQPPPPPEPAPPPEPKPAPKPAPPPEPKPAPQPAPKPIPPPVVKPKEPEPVRVPTVPQVKPKDLPSPQLKPAVPAQANPPMLIPPEPTPPVPDPVPVVPPPKPEPPKVEPPAPKAPQPKPEPPKPAPPPVQPPQPKTEPPNTAPLARATPTPPAAKPPVPQPAKPQEPPAKTMDALKEPDLSQMTVRVADLQNMLALTPMPAQRDLPLPIPAGEARGRFAISPQPNLTANTTEPGSKLENPAAPGAGHPTVIAGANAPNGDAASSTAAGSGTNAGAGKDKGASNAGATAGSGRGAGTAAASGTETGAGSGKGAGPKEGPFAGITIVGGVRDPGAAANTALNPPSPRRPLQTSFGITVISTENSGGGLPAFGVFGKRQVYTVFLDMRETEEDPAVSWTLEFAVLQETAQAGAAQNQQGLLLPFPAVKQRPAFPPDLERKYAGKMIIVYAVVNREGKLEQIAVKDSPDPYLNDTVISTLSRWSFRPAQMDGAPVAAIILMGIPVMPLY